MIDNASETALEQENPMPETSREKSPWMIAAWPGMGHVAVSAGYYLMAKLGMKQVAEFSSDELFDLDYIDVKDGLISLEKRPRNRVFQWENPHGKRDIMVFIGEAQPPLGKYAFCQHLVAFARERGVERVFTFAAMATQMHPDSDGRVFGAATDGEQLRELQQRGDVDLLNDGQISGLNGVLLGVAAEEKLRGTCLLGEMPHIFSQLPYPKASLAVLEVFASMAEIDLDFTELREHAEVVDQQLAEVLAKAEEALGRQLSESEEEFAPDQPEEERLSEQDLRRIEELFTQAEQDRSKAYELKRELDRLDVFADYENRFLDLFKREE